ncbi:MAG TPA: transposase [Chryseosolibacter sp.]
MSFQCDRFYHIYNRGNNKQKIFFTNANYRFFLQKVAKEIAPASDLVCYCLMPNHYHFMIYFGSGHRNFRQAINMENLERKIGTLQSSYTRAINYQEKRVGSLFQAKFKVVDIDDFDQARTCFRYIHRNPVKAGLVAEAQKWIHSSFNEYLDLTDGLCNKNVAYERLHIPQAGQDFWKWSQRVVDEADEDRFWL